MSARRRRGRPEGTPEVEREVLPDGSAAAHAEVSAPAAQDAATSVADSAPAVGDAAPAVGDAASAVGDAASAAGDAAPFVGDAASAAGRAALPGVVTAPPVAGPTGNRATPASRTRVWPGRLLRLATGLVVLALTGAVVVGARSLDEPLALTADPSSVGVAAARSTLVCAGPLQLPDDSSAGSSDFDPTPVAPVEAVQAFSVPAAGGAVPTGALSLLGSAAVSAPLTVAGARLPAPTAPVVVTADPTDGEAARVAGATTSLVTAGDLRGLSAAACQRPSSDLWLVGGSTELESTDQLVVVNSGTTPAEVTLTVFGPAGPVELVGGSTVLVAPGAQQVLTLGGLAAEQRRIALHLTAAGGRVTATLQDSRLDGFTPQGTDLVSPGAAPQERQVVPGVVVGASTADATDAAVLRLLAPGAPGAPGDAAATAITATVTLLGADGAVALPGVEDVELAPGEVTDVPLGGLPAGAYTVVVDATGPVVAAAMITRPGTAGELDDTPSLERAWVASGAGGDLVAVPAASAGIQAAVVLSAIGADDPTAGAAATGVLRAIGSDGVVAERDVSVPAGQTVSIDVASLGTGITGLELVEDGAEDTGSVASTTTLAWSLLLTATRPDGELVSVLTPLADQGGARQVQVRPETRLGLG
ncbi:hypothetical protein AGMMS50218_11400 [Actinomycetota bacterium]|nr:hypothetical protein AGMMS50218_11400 [Actinomycetota bacterium]